MVKIGLTLYDWLAGRERIGHHRTLAVAELVNEVAGLRTTGLIGGFEFFDAQMDDARLCLEVVLTSMASGAVAANYVEVVGMRRGDGVICGCDLRNVLTGDCFYATARRVVNAAGPWLDDVCRLDDSTAQPRLATSKGVHIILPSMGLRAGLLVTHPTDGRVMFVLPWMSRTLVGATDTFFRGGPDELAAEPSDADYLIAAVNHYLGRSLSRSDVIGTLAGLRPLLNQNVKQPSAASREFAIVRSRSGVWSIAGGKYTTYRSMAEKLMDQVVDDLRGSASAVRSRTATHRLIGAPAEDWQQFRNRERQEIITTHGVEPMQIDHLLDRYGVRARSLVTDHIADTGLWQQVVPGEPEIWAEFHYQARHEMALVPADYLLRRTRLGLFRPGEFAAQLKSPRPLAREVHQK
jgi:glycerol-3-phosphate dehydrogenase